MKKIAIKLLVAVLIFYTTMIDGFAQDVSNTHDLSDVKITEVVDGLLIEGKVAKQTDQTAKINYEVLSSVKDGEVLIEAETAVIEGKFQFQLNDSLFENCGDCSFKIVGKDENGNVVFEKNIDKNLIKKDTVQLDQPKLDSTNTNDKAGLDLNLNNAVPASVPVIENVIVSGVVNGGYTIEATITATNGLDRVVFPTWTEKNGQDDIKWENGIVNGDKVTFTVKLSDHNYENGTYNTHIYAYDKAGGLSVQGVSKDVQLSAPVISNVIVGNVENGAYTIEATVNAERGIDRVVFPTWTEKNGQDDIMWQNGKVVGNKVTFTVKLSDHNNEGGLYNTHIYAYDKSGELVVEGITKQVQNFAPVIRDVRVGNVENGTYTIEATVNAERGLDRVVFPTWTEKNGQDDIKWENGIVNGDRVTFTVKLSDHNYENGIYNTHIYAYDKAGGLSVQGISKDVQLNAPVISDVIVGDVENGAYTIEATINAERGIDRVVFPTWTEVNGQDDIKWQNGKVVGNKVTYTVKLSDHNNEGGLYNTHIYAYDKSGELVVEGITKQVRDYAPVISNVQIGSEENGVYTIEATVEAERGIDRVSFPTWTEKNGQDDIKWEDGIVNGNTVTFTVKLSDHNYESGVYNTHIYAYDKAGRRSTYGVTKNVVIDSTPMVQNINVTNAPGSYTITFNVTDTYGIKQVQGATWTKKNGQDDLMWKNASVVNGKVTINVNYSDHKFELGQYYTHVYVYSNSGSRTIVPVDAIMTGQVMTPGWQIMNGKKYLFNNQGEVVQGARQLIIDISEHNGIINWEQVKASGVDGVILRVGYGWHENLETQRDKLFNRNANELERLGIPYGVYLFSYETSAAGAVKEAEYTLNLIKGRRLSLPIYYDLEYDKVVGNLPQSTYVAMARAYAERIKASGYVPGIYANLNYWNNKLNDPSLDIYTKWVAQYNRNDGTAGQLDYGKPVKMWQYTSSGNVSGISGRVDMNALYE